MSTFFEQGSIWDLIYPLVMNELNTKWLAMKPQPTLREYPELRSDFQFPALPSSPKEPARSLCFFAKYPASKLEPFEHLSLPLARLYSFHHSRFLSKTQTWSAFLLFSHFHDTVWIAVGLFPLWCRHLLKNQQRANILTEQLLKVHLAIVCTCINGFHPGKTAVPLWKSFLKKCGFSYNSWMFRAKLARSQVEMEQ